MSMRETNSASQARQQLLAEAVERERDQRRYEIAQAAARMMIGRDGLLGDLAPGDVARKAVRFADALIAELQRPTADDTDKEPG